MITITKKIEKDIKDIFDDIELDNEIIIIEDYVTDDNYVSDDKINALRDRFAKKEKIVEKTSYKFGVIGIGKFGSGISQEFYNMGYDSIAISVNNNDLQNISIPDDRKLFIDIKKLSIDRAILNEFETIKNLIINKLLSCQIIILPVSFGDKSDHLCVDPIMQIVKNMCKPIIILGVLPKEKDDYTLKLNTINSLSKFPPLIDDTLKSIYVIDNERLEKILSVVDDITFNPTSNKLISNIFNVFNVYSSKFSAKPVSPTDFYDVLLNSYFSTLGELSIYNFDNETDIAESIAESLKENIFIHSNDYSCKTISYIFLAHKEVLDRIPPISFEYAHAMICDIFNKPDKVYRGVYESNDVLYNTIKLYVIITELTFPNDKIAKYNKEIYEQQYLIKAKEIEKSLDKSNIQNNVEAIKQKISQRLANKKNNNQ